VTLIRRAPEAFDGTLQALYEEAAAGILLESRIVEAFHQKLVSYLESADPLFLVRAVRGQQRGATTRNRHGWRLRATDNSPAWWIHAKLFMERSAVLDDFDRLIEAVPCHMFRIRLRDSINAAGWHVAHIFDAKDRNTAFDEWDRREVVKRMVRNIHPCNYFFFPHAEWRRYGGDPVVISFFYEKFAVRYSSVWAEFLVLADAKPVGRRDKAEGYRIRFEAAESPRSETAPKLLSAPNRRTDAGDRRDVVAHYRSARLTFKADVIEPLETDMRFRIDTPAASYVMTKREFYETFPRIPLSRSYREARVYSFPTPPERASRFRIAIEEESNS